MVDTAMSELIGLVYEAALQPALWDNVMEQLTVTAPSAVATFYAHDLVTRAPAFQALHGSDPAYLQDYVERWAAANPIVEAMRLMQPGEVASLDMIMDYEAFARTPFFIEWGRPQGYLDAVNIMLERTPTRLASVSLIRHDRHGRVDAATLGRLEVLAPHLQRSVRIGRALDFASVERETIVASLDALAMPVVLVDRSGDAVHANRSGQDLLAGTFSAETIRKAARTAMQSDAPETTLLKAPDGARWACHWARLEPKPGQNVLGMLVLRDSAAAHSTAKSIGAVFKLTPRETDVFFHVTELCSVTGAAVALGVSKETIRTHLRSIFGKTKTRSQAELVRLAAQLAPPFLQADGARS